MKLWEERWEKDLDGMCRPILWVEGEGMVLSTDLDQDDERLPRLAERVKLAAAAPDLVRALLAVEWFHEYCSEGCGRGEDTCFACGATKGWDHTNHCETAVHAKDCVVDAALRKAGVR